MESPVLEIVASPEGKVGAVLVVGAGISGMQSALDLANAGFKVYLVDKNVSIGGVMAQLDKTFPTNDCSTCMISPKLIEVASNPNIEIMTRTQVKGIPGDPGTFYRGPLSGTAICQGGGLHRVRGLHPGLSHRSAGRL